MGHWGVASHENDGASEALDAGFERARGKEYDALMDDRNRLSYDEVQKELACPETLAAAVEALREEVGLETAWEDWDAFDRLAFVGVVVRHAEFGVKAPEDWRARAVDWLENEPIDWPEATLRGLRRQREITLLRGQETNP